MNIQRMFSHSVLTIAFLITSLLPVWAHRGFDLKAEKHVFEDYVSWNKWFACLVDDEINCDLLAGNRKINKHVKSTKHEEYPRVETLAKYAANGEEIYDVECHPLFKLDECPCVHSSRLTDFIRELKEDKLLERVLKRYKDKAKRRVYTSFGSANLFQDVIIICKLLEQGYTNIRVNLIDESYTLLIALMREGKIDKLQWLDKVTIEHPLYKWRNEQISSFANKKIFKATALKDYLSTLFNVLGIHEKSALGRELSEAVYNDSLGDYGYGTIADVNNRLVQFVRFFSHYHGGKVSIRLYGGVMGADYFRDCLDDESFKSHILVGFDVDHDLSWALIEAAKKKVLKVDGVFVGFRTGTESGGKKALRSSLTPFDNFVIEETQPEYVEFFPKRSDYNIVDEQTRRSLSDWGVYPNSGWNNSPYDGYSLHDRN